LKITCHRKIRHHQVHRGRQCARIIILNYILAATPAVMANFELFSTRSYTFRDRGGEERKTRGGLPNMHSWSFAPAAEPLPALLLDCFSINNCLIAIGFLSPRISIF